MLDYLEKWYEYSSYGERKVFVSAGANDPGCYAPTLVSGRRTMYTMVGGMYDNPVSVPDQPFGLCEFGHQGLPHEEEIDNGSMIQNRMRIRRGGTWHQRDPWQKDRSRLTAGDGYQDGMSLYGCLNNKPITSTDPEGKQIAVRSPIPPPRSPCDGYRNYLNSTCTYLGCITRPDTYPQQAYPVCQGFLAMYNNSQTVQCVADCLTEVEDKVQILSSCKLRNSMRLGAHIGCYAQCGFTPNPFTGMPPGASSVGWGSLLPSFFLLP